MQTSPLAATVSQPYLDEVMDFMKILWILDEGLQRRSRRMFSRMGITGPQRMVLRMAEIMPGSTANSLARQLHLHPSTVSGIVRRLESEKFLARLPHPTDGRSYRLQLTERGHSVVGRDETGTVEAAVRRMIASAPSDKVQSTKEVLLRLADELGNFNQPATRPGTS